MSSAVLHPDRRFTLAPRLVELIRDRFGAPPRLVTLDDSSVLPGEDPESLCDRAATLAARHTLAGAAFYACPIHPDLTELAAPILVDGDYRGCLHARARPGSDLDLLRELLLLGADEIASLARDAQPPSSSGDLDGRDRPPTRSYGIVGHSRSMQELYRVLDKVVDSESTVLVQGENGTGKELVARAIHYHSRRAEERFVVQNCSAFNDNLLDSELFGHKRGAFTGAIADKPGLFEVAHRGTFFLDEVGDMSPALQVKLLRVLQEGTFTPVGETATRTTDVRIIAASNRDLRRMVDQGSFREDLYYRINVINLVIPPLRERRDDIPLLVEHFLDRFARSETARTPDARRVKPKRLARPCLDRLLDYDWPGNIRELENEIERLIVLAGEQPILDEDLLSPRIRQAASPVATEAGADPGSLNDAMDALECNLILEMLQRTRWNKTRAAQQLRISRRNLIRKVDKYKLDQRRTR